MIPKLLALVFFGIGIFVLVQVALPIFSYKLWEFTTYKRENTALVSPNPNNINILGVSIQNTDNFPALISNKQRSESPPYPEFTITIPSIKLERIKVKVDSNSFENSLAQLPGSAMPGEKGNLFITGHSSLPQTFSPTNFKTIFSSLPDIKKGDLILVEGGGQRFEYIVQGLKVVDPKATWVINPPDQNGRYLSLMTCVPPGVYLKRLIVLASLKQS